MYKISKFRNQFPKKRNFKVTSYFILKLSYVVTYSNFTLKLSYVVTYYTHENVELVLKNIGIGV